MRRITAALTAILISLTTPGYAEIVLLAGKITKASTGGYTLTTKAAWTYQLQTVANSPQRELLASAAKIKHEVFLLGEIEKRMTGTEGGGNPLPGGEPPLFTVKSVLSPNASGVSEVIFESLACTDSCRLTFSSAKGKKQTYFANGSLSNLKDLLTDDTLKGKSMRIYWEKHKSSRVVMFAEIL